MLTGKINTTSNANKANIQPNPVSSIGGRFTVGDTKGEQVYIKFKNSEDKEKWLKEFDNIDVAPKNGILSLNEICDYRDKQITKAKWACYSHPLFWAIEVKSDFKTVLKFAEEQAKTDAYRQVNETKTRLK